MTPLSEQEIQQRLADSEWRRDGHVIAREWVLTDFDAAIAFVNRVAELAQAANHHPEILLHGWNKVRLELSTHSARGLTAADFALAAQIDALV